LPVCARPILEILLKPYYNEIMKTTKYFLETRKRPDRRCINTEWIEQTILHPDVEFVQKDGRIRRWKCIPEAEDRFLRVVLLEDGETVHNAFFDRRFKG